MGDGKKQQQKHNVHIILYAAETTVLCGPVFTQDRGDTKWLPAWFGLDQGTYVGKNRFSRARLRRGLYNIC